MGKLPWVKYYYADIEQDTKGLTPTALGVWLRILHQFWHHRHKPYKEFDGTLVGDINYWGNIVGCTKSQAKSTIMELIEKNVCIGNSINNKITIGCRRTMAEQYEKEACRLRQKKLRESGGGNPKRWTAVRVIVLKRDNYICQYCGKKATTVDHVIPKSRGGTEDDCNLVAACKSCNMRKTNKTPGEAKLFFIDENLQMSQNVRISHEHKRPVTASERADVTQKNAIEAKKSLEAKNTDTNIKKKINKKEGFILPDWVNQELWIELLAHRKKRKAPNSDRALKAIINNISKLMQEGHKPDDLLEKILERGWLTIEKAWLQTDNQQNNNDGNRLEDYHRRKAEQARL